MKSWALLLLASVSLAAGERDAAKTRPLRKDSNFRIASDPKPVTAVAVMTMQDEGKLSIEDPLSEYIPAFGNNCVTLRHKLTYISGMGEATPAPFSGAKWKDPSTGPDNVKFGQLLLGAGN